MKKTILLSLLGISLCAGASYGVYEYFIDGRCNPYGTCHACKNCKYCKHCAKQGGTCSVCK